MSSDDRVLPDSRSSSTSGNRGERLYFSFLVFSIRSYRIITVKSPHTFAYFWKYKKIHIAENTALFVGFKPIFLFIFTNTVAIPNLSELT